MVATDRPQILVVEDEMMIAMLLEDMFDELHYEMIGPCATVAAALDLVRQRHIDAALLDVNVRTESVYPLAEALEANDVPFAFATGYGSQGIAGPWSSHPVISKPYQQRDVHRVISALMQAKAQPSDLRT